MHRCSVLIRLFPVLTAVVLMLQSDIRTVVDDEALMLEAGAPSDVSQAAQSTTAAIEAMSDRFGLDANCEPRESEAMMELGVAGAADAIFSKKKT